MCDHVCFTNAVLCECLITKRALEWPFSLYKNNKTFSCYISTYFALLKHYFVSFKLNLLGKTYANIFTCRIILYAVWFYMLTNMILTVWVMICLLKWLVWVKVLGHPSKVHLSDGFSLFFFSYRKTQSAQLVIFTTS